MDSLLPSGSWHGYNPDHDDWAVFWQPLSAELQSLLMYVSACADCKVFGERHAKGAIQYQNTRVHHQSADFCRFKHHTKAILYPAGDALGSNRGMLVGRIWGFRWWHRKEREKKAVYKHICWIIKWAEQSCTGSKVIHMYALQVWIIAQSQQLWLKLFLWQAARVMLSVHKLFLIAFPCHDHTCSDLDYVRHPQVWTILAALSSVMNCWNHVHICVFRQQSFLQKSNAKKDANLGWR